MRPTDSGPLPGASGGLETEADTVAYRVAAGDTASVVARRFGREPWQLLDEDGKLVQWLADTDVRPLVPGERLVLTDLGFVETLDAGAGSFDEDDLGAEHAEVVLPPAHPRYLAVFGDPLYEDQVHDFAPFGSDEGWDAMAELVLHHPPLTEADTVRALAERLWDWDDGSAFDADGLMATEYTDPAVIGIAFTLLRSTGGVDEEGRRRLLDALRRQQERFGNDGPEFGRILADLARYLTLA